MPVLVHHAPKSLAVHLNLALLLTCSVFGACKAVDIATPSQATLGGQIEFYMSGGFAGIRQGLMVDDTGQIVFRDDKRGIRLHGQIDPSRLEEVRASFVAINAENGSTPKQLGAKCADCFQYSIKATIGGRLHRVFISSAAIQESPYSGIVKTLSQIMREILTTQRM